MVRLRGGGNDDGADTGHARVCAERLRAERGAESPGHRGRTGAVGDHDGPGFDECEWIGRREVDRVANDRPAVRIGDSNDNLVRKPVSRHTGLAVASHLPRGRCGGGGRKIRTRGNDDEERQRAAAHYDSRGEGALGRTAYMKGTARSVRYGTGGLKARPATGSGSV